MVVSAVRRSSCERAAPTLMRTPCCTGSRPTAKASPGRRATPRSRQVRAKPAPRQGSGRRSQAWVEGLALDIVAAEDFAQDCLALAQFLFLRLDDARGRTFFDQCACRSAPSTD